MMTKSKYDNYTFPLRLKVVEVTTVSGAKYKVKPYLLGSRTVDPEEVVTQASKGFANGYFFKGYTEDGALQVNINLVESYKVTYDNLPDDVKTAIEFLNANAGKELSEADQKTYDEKGQVVETYFAY